MGLGKPHENLPKDPAEYTKFVEDHLVEMHKWIPNNEDEELHLHDRLVPNPEELEADIHFVNAINRHADIYTAIGMIWF